MRRRRRGQSDCPDPHILTTAFVATITASTYCQEEKMNSAELRIDADYPGGNILNFIPAYAGMSFVISPSG